MNKLNEKINGLGSLTIAFAKHFNTSSASIKNLLSGYNKIGVLSVIFNDEKYGNELVGYSNVQEVFEDVLCEAFEVYTNQVDIWINSPEGNRRTLDRVQFFIGLVQDICSKKEYNGIYSTFGDFIKTTSGKEIEQIVTSVYESEDVAFISTKLTEVLMMLAFRTTINKAMNDEVEVINPENVEVISSEMSAHQSPKPEDNNTDNKPPITIGEKLFGKKIFNMFSSVDSKSDDDSELEKKLRELFKNGGDVYISAFVEYAKNECEDGLDIIDLIVMLPETFDEEQMKDVSIPSIAVSVGVFNKLVNIPKAAKKYLFMLSCIYAGCPEEDTFVDLGKFVYRCFHQDDYDINNFMFTEIVKGFFIELYSCKSEPQEKRLQIPVKKEVSVESIKPVEKVVPKVLPVTPSSSGIHVSDNSKPVEPPKLTSNKDDLSPRFGEEGYCGLGVIGSRIYRMRTRKK